MTGGGDPARLEVLRRTGLLDSAREPAFDRLARLAAGLLGAPVALVSLVDDTRQFFKSAIGLKEPWASLRQTPLSLSFCQHVCRARTRLVVTDARDHPELRDNLAIDELAAIAYVGVPLMVSSEAIGAFCVIDHKPRAWSDHELALLEDLGASVVSEIELRIASRQAREQRAVLEAIVESIGDAVLAADANRTFLVANGAARRIFADGAAVGAALPGDWSAVHASTDKHGQPLPSEDGALFRALRGLDTDGLTFTLSRPGQAGSVWLEATGRTVRDPEGAIVAAVATYRDVTERQKQADLYSTLARNIPRGAVSLFDRELRCMAIDGSALREDGLAPERLIGRTMRELAGERGDERFDRIEALYRRVLAGETLTTDFDAGERWLALHMAPVRDGFEDTIAGIVLALDVTAERRLAAQLRQKEQIDRAILRNLPNGAVFMVDRSMRYAAADGPILPEILRRANVDELVGRRVEEVSSGESREAILEIYRDTLAGASRHAELRRGDLFFDVNTVPVLEGAEVTHALVLVHDITQRRQEAEALRLARDSLARERKLFESVLEHLVEGVALIDPKRKVLLANPAFAQMLDLDPEQVAGMTFDQFVERVSPLLAEPRSLVDCLIAAPPEGAAEFLLVRPRRRILRRAWTPVVLDEGLCTLAMWQDVTAERDLLAQRERQLLVDALTGMPNRRAAESAMRVEHDRVKRYGTPLSVALIDVDHFKQVNDAWGHGAGDEVLRGVAGTLMATARASDTVARWGGEEFIAILPVALDGARAFAERARRAIESMRCHPAGHVTISVGAAQVASGETIDQVVVRADERLYDSKRGGRNRVSF